MTQILMTQAEYARHRGISRPAVHKMVKKGRIPTVDGGKRIDVGAAETALADGEEPVNTEDLVPRHPMDPTPAAAVGLTKARAVTETFRARKAEADYLERIGKLLSVEDVVRAMEICAEALVREIDQLPTKSADLLAAYNAEGQAAHQKALKAVARELRAVLAEKMRLLAKDS